MPDWRDSVAQAREGSLEAFDLVVQRFKDMAVAYAYSLLGDFHLAEDAAQEAFIQAYLDLGSLRVPQAFPSWFRQIVFKHCDRLTRRKRLPTTPLDEEQGLPAPADDPAETAARHDVQDQILGLVRSLPEREWSVTALFYIDGYTCAEVGEFLDLPVSTVKNRLHAARGKLRERMVETMEETLKQHRPTAGFDQRVKKVLEGIGRIHWRTTSPLCFVGSVVAALRHLGEQLEPDYVMGISGGAFKAFWIPPWSPANCDLLLAGEEPVRRTFGALGYGYTVIRDYDRLDPAHTKEFFRAPIVRSLDAGRPVLAIGVVGPPAATSGRRTGTRTSTGSS